jgi:thiol:disulfide interchange protein DsbD
VLLIQRSFVPGTGTYFGAPSNRINSAGVVVTFVVLGLVLAALRAAGEQLGWGFQLQSPAVVTALAILFFVLALNLSGVFEFGQLVPAGVAVWSSKNRAIDAFGSGCWL